MDSTALEGDAGTLGCLCWTGEADGVDGPRNEAKRLMDSKVPQGSSCMEQIVALFGIFVKGKQLWKTFRGELSY